MIKRRIDHGFKRNPYLGNGKDNYSNANFIKCQKCGHEYFRTWEYCPQCRAKAESSSVFIWLIPLVILIIMVGVFVSLQDKTGATNYKDNLNTSPNSIVEDDDRDAFSQPIVTPPPTGIYQLFTTEPQIAPFNTVNHSDNNCNFLKFKNIDTQTIAFTIFLNQNENCNINIPLGNYELSLATGDT